MSIRWMWQFFLLVLRDTFKQWLNVVQYLSGIKIAKLFVVTFFTFQFFYFLNKFFVYFDFTFSLREILYLLFIVLLFPFLFTLEKFVSATFFAYSYDSILSDNFWIAVKEKLIFFFHPKRIWPVYILSQAAVMIEVVIFSFIFSLVFLATNFELHNSATWIMLFFGFLGFVFLFIVSVWLWNHTSQVFRFWDSSKDFTSALTESRNFTTQFPRKFITLHTIVKAFQFAVPTAIALLVFNQAYLLLSFLDKHMQQNFSIYMTMSFLSILSFVLYQFLVTFANVYSFRLANYFETGTLNPDFIPSKVKNRKDLAKLSFANNILIAITFCIFVWFIHLQIVSAKNLTEKVKTNFPNVIKLYSESVNSTTTIEAYLTPSYANGIAVQAFVENDGLYVQPLVSESKNPLVPTTLSLADLTFFNLSQTFIDPSLKIYYKDAIGFSNSRKFTLFVYITDEQVLDKLLNLQEKSLPHFTVFFTDNLALADELKQKVPNYRVGSVVKVVDANSYSFSQIFIFNKDLKQKDLENLKKKGVQVYILMQEGEVPDPSIDLSSVQGVFTNLPKISYNQVRNISEQDILKQVILSPLKLFGF